MKCFAAVVLLALFAIALAEQPAKTEKIELVNDEAATAPRDKRGVLVGAAYTAPVAYSSYAAPVAYSAYNVPYAYSAYRTYPYYYSSPVVYG
ncbi:hypothetical protein KM043_018378 [Ampulex compressa]|nr:hypothetical protein KM043_018378 [Ampulex compressa]